MNQLDENVVAIAKERVIKILEIARPIDDTDKDDISASLAALAAAYVAMCKVQKLTRDQCVGGILAVWIEGESHETQESVTK
jgi:hypothetical protein